MPEHTVKRYDQELNQMTDTILRMGGMVEQQLAKAITALITRDPELATTVIADDKPIDQLEHEIDQLVMRLLALRQPMAVDLRLITASLKISSDLERIGDYAANVAKRASALKALRRAVASWVASASSLATRTSFARLALASSSIFEASSATAAGWPSVSISNNASQSSGRPILAKSSTQ